MSLGVGMSWVHGFAFLSFFIDISREGSLGRCCRGKRASMNYSCWSELWYRHLSPSTHTDMLSPKKELNLLIPGSDTWLIFFGYIVSSSHTHFLPSQSHPASLNFLFYRLFIAKVFFTRKSARERKTPDSENPRLWCWMFIPSPL